MFARALLAFLALPGVVAFAVPVALVSRELSHSAGAATGLGAAGGRFCRAALVCSRLLRFRQAPWAPPAHLVIVGLYRYTRNPMYVAVALILLGWAVSFGSLGLFLYTITWP
jgi:protein-S-isoprenylcysteine O-methyltransferase Ste14